MKSAALLSLAAVALIGCTTTTETTTTRTTAATARAGGAGATPVDENRIGNRRTYTHDDIQSTGRSGNIGEALSTLDAGVYTSGR